MATERDRYQNHTYTSSRDRGRDEHARQDLDAPDYSSGPAREQCRLAVMRRRKTGQSLARPGIHERRRALIAALRK